MYEIDDIRTVYHPASGIPTRVDHFEQYRSNPTFQHADPPIDPCPWRPFATRRDFKLGEFILDSALTNKNMTTLFELLTPESESIQGLGSTINSPRDFKEHWDQAANLITPFEKSMVTVPLRGRDQTFDVYRRNLWMWALELIQNPTLEPHFFWDAVKLSKWNGKAFERFIDEPWTAQAFWDLQTPLPKGAKPLCFILYANKTRLSLFGTAQAYPVVARCANLRAEIRNGNGVGGGRVVGWLPLIKDDRRYKNKTYYVDFKRSVWHAAMKYILEPLEEPSKVGSWVHLQLCDEDLQMFPRVPIISCDFEEACFVVLTRGTNGLKPCVICLVPKTEQYNLRINYELRTLAQTREVLGDAAGLPTKGAQNKFLSGFGLRNIQNAFWNVTDCDPFRSLSWDRLHAHDDGLFGTHLRGELIARVEALGMQSIGQADDQIKLFPHWKDFYHFESGFMGVTYTDGGKYEDLAKHIIFVTHNILTEARDEHGYLLLKSFNLHTETTLQAIRDELIKFSDLIKEYEQLTMSVKPKAKSWNFPKIHSHKHLVDDILAKGVMQNYNTKPNEKMHGPLKDAYQLRTNFKEVTEQILRVDSWCNAASFIHQQIDLQDELLCQATSEDDDDNDDEVMAGTSGKATLHGHRGKGGGTFKIQELPILRADDAAYGNLKDRLSDFMVEQFEKHPEIVPLVSGEKMTFKGFKAHDEIRLYGLLKVNYENAVDWNMYTDYLRCSPDFYNHPRYDCVIVEGPEGPFFSQTIMLFSCIVGGKSFPLALVHPFDEPVGASTAKIDQDLGFYRVRARKRTKLMFISVYNIIRGALLVEDYGFTSPDGTKEYLVVDSVDSDLFLRMKSLQYVGRRRS
ncbi:hypothetical protein EDD18DRAFT_1315910 [Armillaria luteobubalina]|uniref:Uncharacterized protein n=1 Tax=Armillaria luteobubalina TaxID=153913 RepID=A0AA39QRV7_9AGAR|nr:hypothetical protein EDD18DRAFT_1315910 [Armillaria luteobubalina]